MKSGVREFACVRVWLWLPFNFGGGDLWGDFDDKSFRVDDVCGSLLVSLVAG